MIVTYTINKTPFGESIIRNNDGFFTEIPMDESNSDYQKYLKDIADAKE